MGRTEEERRADTATAVRLLKGGTPVREIASTLNRAIKTVRADLQRALGRRYHPRAGKRPIPTVEIRRRRLLARNARTWSEYEALVHPDPGMRRSNPKLDRRYGIRIRGRSD